MAKFQSTVYSSIKGSVGGLTYYQGVGGMTVRARTFPDQPVSLHRTTVKNAFTEAVGDWQVLTPIQQGDWQLWATAHLPPQSGRHAMIAGKSLLRYMAELPLATAPVIAAGDLAPQFTTTPSFNLTTGAPVGHITGVNVAIKNTGHTTCHYIIEVSAQFSGSRNFWKGPWDVPLSKGLSVAAGATGNADIDLGIVAGNYVFIRVRGVTNDATVGLKGHVVTAVSIVRQLVQTTP